MTFLSVGKTRSGFPGRLGTWSRNLYPHERAILFTTSSGFVPLLRMSAILLLRSDRVSVSIGSTSRLSIVRMLSQAADDLQVREGSRCGKATLLRPSVQAKCSLFHRHVGQSNFEQRTRPRPGALLTPALAVQFKTNSALVQEIPAAVFERLVDQDAGECLGFGHDGKCEYNASGQRKCIVACY